MAVKKDTQTGNTWWIAVEGVTLNDGSGPVMVTDAAQFDSFLTEVRDQDDALLDTLTMTESTDPDAPAGTWQAAVNAPDLPRQNVTLTPIITKGTSRWAYGPAVLRIAG